MSLTIADDGTLVVDYQSPPTPTQDRILMSFFTRRGAFFLRPGFGRRRTPRAKLIASTVEDVVNDGRASLQWMIDAGLLQSVEVRAEIVRPGRIDVVVSATDGLRDFEVPFWIPIPPDSRAAT